MLHAPEESTQTPFTPVEPGEDQTEIETITIQSEELQADVEADVFAVVVPDCLVLKIQDFDPVYGLDTTLYILYDVNTRHYVLRGQRTPFPSIVSEENKRRHSVPFSFVSSHTKGVQHLLTFVSFVLCKELPWSMVLYNYVNLPKNSNHITYEFLSQHECGEIELVGYDKQTYKPKLLKRLICMLQHVFNEF